jgi:tRNA pseudouridine38-40 synthase
VCHFDTETPFPDEKWVHVLNQELPHDLAVVKADRVDPLFHSRFWALHRYYQYRIQVGVRDPLRNRQVFSYPKSLDFEAMKEAAKALPGTHDFLAFSQLVDPKKSTVRRLHTVELSQVRDEIRIDIVGSAFVRGMMRRISGALWDIGRGARPVEEIANLLTERDKRTIKWPTVLPARGLCLMKVSYGRHPKPQVKLHKKERFLAEEDSDE